MSVIQTIRNRYAKPAGAIIALSLVVFIVQSALEGSLGNLFRNRSTAIAKVDGSSVDMQDYSRRVSDYEKLYKAFGQPVNEETRTQIRQQAINEMVVEKIILKDAEKLGITAGDAEVKEAVYGADQDPVIKQFLSKVLGSSDPKAAKQLEAELKKAGNDPRALEVGEQWEAVKNYVARNRVIQKYQALVGGAVSQPAFIAKRQMADESQMASIRFVKVPATAIPDSEVPVTDADLKAYMDKHASMYQVTDPGRDIEYVVFDVKPNSQDTARALGTLQKMTGEFTSTPDVENYVKSNSDTGYAPVMATRKSFMSRYANDILSLPEGGVFGPYYENGSYKLTRVESIRQQPDSVKAQHILIATQSQQNPEAPTDSAAHKTADSLLAAVKTGASFDSLAKKFSVDGTKDKGGDLGYFAYGQMVPEFNAYTFDGKTGDMGVVRTQFGYHVIRITDQKAFQPASKLATITKNLTISDAAENTAYGKANEFAGKNTTAQAFDAAAGKNGVNKMTAEGVKPYDFAVNGMSNGARELIRWAYDNKVGAVSNPFRMGDRYVVAKVAGIQEKGKVALTTQNRPMIEAAVKAEKKLDKIAQKYKGQGVDAIAAASGQQVSQADSVLANAGVIPGAGYEPKVVGYAFYPKFQTGQTSPAIKGRDGVYFMTLVNRATVAKSADPAAQKQMQQMANMQLRQAISSTLMQQLARRADVEYNAGNIN